MLKIEKAIATTDALRGVIYLRNDNTGMYEDEIGEADLFYDEGTHFFVYLYLAESYRDRLALTDRAAITKLNLEEKLVGFIGDNHYLTERPTLTLNISFLSGHPALIYET